MEYRGQEDRALLAQKAYDRGFYHQSHERCCSQSTVAAVMEALGFKDPGVFKASTALGGGGALFGDSACGAYTGGLLVLGLLKGRPIERFFAEETDRFSCFEAGRMLHSKFIAEYGTVVCRDIMTRVYGRPYFPVDEDEFRKLDAAGSHTTVGPAIVGNGAKWTVEVIFDYGLLREVEDLPKRG